MGILIQADWGICRLVCPDFMIHDVEIDYDNKVQNMSNTYIAITKKEGNWWIGWIEEVSGVNCQEPTREELLESLRISLAEMPDFNRQGAQ